MSGIDTQFITFLKNIMSTTFGVRIPLTGEVIEVAFRSHYIRWENKLAHLLPDDLPVIPLDNSAQGIHTIGDIKKAINQQNEPL